MADYKFLQYETHDDGAIVRILLDRPDARNRREALLVLYGPLSTVALAVNEAPALLM